MLKNRILFLIILVIAVFLNLGATIKVGVYENKPLSFYNSDGIAVGIYPDILDYVAYKENWIIEYVPGTLPELLEMLKESKIDVLVSVSPNNKMKKYLKFGSETVFTDWATIITSKNNSHINSFTDLKNKKIAVLKNGLYSDKIREINDKFNLDLIYTICSDYNEITKTFLEGKADAGVVSRLYYNYNKKYNNSIRNTEIIFSPAKLTFAVNINSKKHLLKIIDYHLKKMKQDPNSIYYHSIEKWTGNKNIILKQKGNNRLFALYFFVILITIYIIFIIHHKENKSIINLKDVDTDFEKKFGDILSLVAINEFTSTGFLAMDKDYNVKIINKSFAKIFSIDKEKIINKNIFEEINLNNLKKFKALFDNTKKEYTKKKLEIEINKVKKTLKISILHDKDLNDNIILILLLVEDLTDSLNLKESVSLLRNDIDQILSRSQNSILITNTKGEITFSNKQFSNVFGFNKIEVENNDIYELLFTDNYHIKKEIEIGKKDEMIFEITCSTKYKKAIKVQINVFKRRLNNVLVGYYFLLKPIREKKIESESCKREKELFSILKNSLRNSLIFRREINKDLNFLYVDSFNNRFLSFYIDKSGTKIKKLYNKKIEEEKEERLREILEQIKIKNNKYLIYYELENANNEIVNIEEKGYAVRDINNNLRHLEGIMCRKDD